LPCHDNTLNVAEGAIVVNPKEKRAVDIILKAAGLGGEQPDFYAVSDENGRVFLLDLSRCEGLATLPPEIGQLSQLNELVVAGCSRN
jgi:hypothetical protein